MKFSIKICYVKILINYCKIQYPSDHEQLTHSVKTQHESKTELYTTKNIVIASSARPNTWNNLP